MSWGRHFSSTVLVLAASAALVLQAKAGSIEGSIRRLPPSPDDPAPKDHYWKVWNGVLPLRDVKPALSDVTIAITGEAKDSLRGCDVTLSSGAMKPQTIAARAGSPLQVHNKDTTPHELSARGVPSPAHVEVAAGKKGTLEVPVGGPWPIVDRNYAHLHGYLHSIPNLVACATISAADKFRVPNLKPGTYQLLVLRGAEQLGTKKITVRSGRPARAEALVVPMKKVD